MQLIQFTNKGLYCAQGNFYIDPWKPVDYAVISHAHSDHAKWGNKKYLCHSFTKPILQLRLGNNLYQTAGWNEPVIINGVSISFFPAGHIIGSAQVRVEYKGEIWVFTGDYKIEDDGISTPYEPVKCHSFITESTFGLPIYKWQPQQQIFNDMQNWIAANKAAGKASIFFAYSLGKAQRILQPLAQTGIPIYSHGAVYNVHTTLQQAGWDLPNIKKITADTTKAELKECIVIAPSSAEGSPWIKRFTPYATGVCSGWMQVRGNVRRRNADAGFALSDHCDWEGLLQAVKACEAEKVYTTHGFQASFSRYLNEQGIEAAEVKTEFESALAEEDTEKTIGNNNEFENENEIKEILHP